MGNVMIVFDEEHERRLRRFAKRKYGGKKGSLSKVVWEALDQMDEKGMTALEQFQDLVKKSKGFEYKMYKNRSDNRIIFQNILDIR